MTSRPARGQRVWELAAGALENQSEEGPAPRGRGEGMKWPEKTGRREAGGTGRKKTNGEREQPVESGNE